METTMTHSPQPEVAKRRKDLIDSRGRSNRFEGEMRDYFCRTCGAVKVGRVIPRGWYGLTRHAGAVDRPMIRLGLYCSIECLAAQLPRLTGVGTALDDGGR